MTLSESYAEFLEERRYLRNVAPKTTDQYRQSWKRVSPLLPLDLPIAELTEPHLKRAVYTLRQGGLSPVSLNTYMRPINAWLKWAGKDFKVRPLKTEQKILPTYTPGHIQRLMDFKPKTANDRRAYLLVAVLLDTGCRLSEALTLERPGVNFDTLQLTVYGKGRKERQVPFSMTLRRHLWRYLHGGKDRYVFSTTTGTHLAIRNAERDIANLCERAGVPKLPRAVHAFRHTFATNYLRKGGNAFYLQRILGHKTLSTTLIYLRSLGAADLQEVHDRFTPLPG